MSRQKDKLRKPDPGSVFLPDMCSGRSLLAMLLVTELVAVVLTLLGTAGGRSMWEELIMLSLYLQWIGLCGAGALCMSRQSLEGYSGRVVVIASFSMLMLVTYVISEMAWLAGQWGALAPYFGNIDRGEFLLRSLGIAALVAALVLRYFWVREQWRRQIQSVGEARYQALQARIRPHFLFNSLNSIAALITINPQAAERAVEDLAELFRVGISTKTGNVRLKEELEITRAYVRTEYLRLGSRLKVLWDIDPAALQYQVPALILQPLVENAVYHGIELLPKGGVISVRIHIRGKGLQILVDNPVPDIQSHSQGTRQALDNIRQRLHIMYGEKCELRSGIEDGQYRAMIRMPLSGQEEDQTQDDAPDQEWVSQLEET